ncbi:MAG TPA: four helix bundle protein [Tepidisphaeraceae bacterium]|nr:four helix bundle protein [Tepidisphaeraceae bacterium]
MNDLKDRTNQFALRVIRLCAVLPRTGPGEVIGRPLVRSGTSVGAQYREAHRARSTAEFVSKLECSAQELDETIYGIELLIDSAIVEQSKLVPLLTEANELMAIFVASARTANRNRKG